MSLAINFFAALSNIVFGYPAYCYATTTFQRMLTTTMICASFLMHISEVKHGLHGVYPFNKWSWWFLQLDRVMAIVCTVYVLFYALIVGVETNWIVGIGGLLCMGCSEFFVDGWWFGILHALWHGCAFYILGLTFNQRFKATP
jgi:hypothetical protein